MDTQPPTQPQHLDPHRQPARANGANGAAIASVRPPQRSVLAEVGVAPQPAPSEVEFKLTVPALQADAVEAEMQRLGTVTTTLLQARYVDTPDDRLAAAGFSFRLRQDNGRWVQTLKRSGVDGNLRRAEHEVERTALKKAKAPAIDLALHAGTVAGDAAWDVLQQAGAAPPLIERFSTRIVRHSVEVDWRGSRIEVSFDQGGLVIGEQQLAVNELEFELKQGGVRTLARFADRWLRRHGLWLQAEAKSDRGLRLVHGRLQPSVAKAQPTQLGPRLSADGLCRAVIASCLGHILPNASAVADGSVDEEHVHQLRVGLRRLRTALRELDGLSRELPRHIDAPVTEAFRRLGAHRDQQTVLEAVKPRLLRAGAQGFGWTESSAAAVDLAAVVRNAAFQSALIDAAAFGLSPGTGTDKDAAALQKKLRPRLRRLHRQVAEHGERFEKLSEDEQHEVRKRLKRLRYLSEFVAPLFGEAVVERYLAALRPAQDALGDHNDVIVARELARAAAATDADARFAHAWLGRTRRKTARKAGDKLRRIDAAPRFWKKKQPRRPAAMLSS